MEEKKKRWIMYKMETVNENEKWKTKNKCNEK